MPQLINSKLLHPILGARSLTVWEMVIERSARNTEGLASLVNGHVGISKQGYCLSTIAFIDFLWGSAFAPTCDSSG